MTKKKLLLFIFLFGMSFVLMTYQVNKESFNPLRIITSPIDTVNNTISSMYVICKNWLRKIQIRDEENQRLREELDMLIIKQQQFEEIYMENARLMELLNLKKKQRSYVTAARVIARGNDRWANTLVIDKGSRNGVEKDMIVITPKGLAGKILSTTDNFSTILLINDINFSAAIRLHETRTEGILSGTGGKICSLKYIPHEKEVRENEAVITSGLDGLYPPDIPAGAVTAINKKASGLFQTIEVTPFQDTAELEEVLIVRK